MICCKPGHSIHDGGEGLSQEPNPGETVEEYQTQDDERADPGV
jgi:hypothetical protein